MKKKSKGSTIPSPVAMDNRWRAESDLRTLRDAEEIKADSSRVRAAKSEAKKQMNALSKVAGGSAPSDRSSREKRLAGRRL
jgi:hypothetical protein